MQPRKDSAVCRQLLNCSYSPSFEDFIILCHENKKYHLELKESLFIMQKSHTCEEGGAHPRIFVWHLLMNLKNNYLLKNC